MRIQVDVSEEDQNASKRRRMAPMWPESWEAFAAKDPTNSQKINQEDLIMRGRAFADPDHLAHLMHSSETGRIQMASLAKQWERSQAMTVHLLRQQLAALDTQRMEAERKHRLIVEANWGPSSTVGGSIGAKRDVGEPACPMEEDDTSTSGATSSQGSSVGSMGSSQVDENENSLEYWKTEAKRLGRLLAESLNREQILLSKLQRHDTESAGLAPVEELREYLHRVDNFLHFSLRKAPVVIAHQDEQLRYRFIFNPYPGLTEEDVLGKTDLEICPGIGMDEIERVKKEAMKTQRPIQREYVFGTDLFGQKTFLTTVEPVISKCGKTLGVNYVGVDITEEAAKREKFIVLREEAAVQKAMETELHRTLVITEESMRAKQMLATMSHEIRSPLSGVVSMAQVLARTRLDAEQRTIVDLMNSSGEHVLELINDILDLSKAESGAMKLEAKKFRPRLVVRRVLQLAEASNQNKNLKLSGHVADDVPEEVVGDVLRIRQVLTNLVSNAMKFTSKGDVIIKAKLVSPLGGGPEVTTPEVKEPAKPTVTTAVGHLKGTQDDTQMPAIDPDCKEPAGIAFRNDLKGDLDAAGISRSSSTVSSVSSLSSNSSISSTTSNSLLSGKTMDEVKVEEEAGPSGLPQTIPAGMWDLSPKSFEMTGEIWLHCEVTDTGIGIPEAALPTLFEEYTQATTTTARKYGGTGLGLAICKQLVSLMGGTLEVKSKQHVGSSFSFTLPLRTVKEGASQGSIADSNPLRRPIVLPGSADVIGKPPKGMDAKLKAYLGRDSKRAWVAIGESPLSGSLKGIADNGIPQVPTDEENFFQSRSDATVSSGSQVPVSETTELNPASMVKPNISRKNPNSLKVSTSSQFAYQKGSPTSPHIEQSTRRAPRILLAEDNNVNVVVAQSMLKKLGLSLEVVNNGAEAVDALQRNEYDLVLMDVSMPVMDGLEATRLIRKLEETGAVRDTDEQPATDIGLPPSSIACEASQDQSTGTDPSLRPSARKKTPIIALTANAMAENVAECYNNGMDSFIAKPVTFEKLEQVLNQYIPWADHRRVQAR